MDFFTSLGLVLLIYFGGKFTALDAITLGTFVAFQRYIQKMVWPMMALGFAVSFYQRAIASSDRMKDIFKLKTDIPESKEPVLPVSLKTGSKIEGRIEFRNLSFSYPIAGEKRALDNISLTIEPGMRVAFVGGIGCGKTSLLSLIPRLYPVKDGMVFVDGVDVNRWPLEALRSQIGFVSQDVFLFSEDVFENIAFGLQQSSREKIAPVVHRAVDAASVGHDIRSLTKGFDTQLGERGVNLSGGQKQRVSLARAIAKDPAILIMDDALSAVDVRTEEAILGGLRSRDHRNTELIAAHRISTVQEADRIFVLHEGKLVQSGNHQELISSKSGIYYRYYEQQRLKEDLERYMKEMDESR
jgi:ATP-binding cassette subfamily B protein